MARSLVTAGNDILRDRHFALNPVTGFYERSTLLELQRTNGWTFSEDLTNAVWVKTFANVTANALAAPDGTLTADKLIEDGALDFHFFNRQLSGLTDNTKQSVTVYVRAGERSWFRVKTIDKANNQRSTWFNLATGVIGTKDAQHASRITRVTGAWYRCEVIWDAAAGATTPQVQFLMATADNGGAYQGDGASGMYFWGLQIEVDVPFGTSYIPTAGATATRSGDRLTLPLAVPLQVPAALTIYARFIERGTTLVTGFAPRILQIGDATASGRVVSIRMAGAARYGISHATNGGSQVNSELVAGPVVGDHVELRGVLNADGSVFIGQSINGAAETVAAPSAANALAGSWASNTVDLGGLTGTAVGAIALLATRIVAGVQSLATMRAL